MTKYELMVIIKSDLDEKSAQSHFADHITGLIKATGAKITFEDFWGSRGFAYMIKNYKFGYYGVIQFDMDPTKASELRREIRLDNNALRFIITKVDKRAPAPRKYAEMKKEYDALEKELKKDEKVKEPAPSREKLTTVGAKKEATSAKAAEEKKAPAKKEEAPKDDLDKKLDAVIEDASVDL